MCIEKNNPLDLFRSLIVFSLFFIFYCWFLHKPPFYGLTDFRHSWSLTLVSYRHFLSVGSLLVSVCNLLSQSRFVISRCDLLPLDYRLVLLCNLPSRVSSWHLRWDILNWSDDCCRLRWPVSLWGRSSLRAQECRVQPSQRLRWLVRWAKLQ